MSETNSDSARNAPPAMPRWVKVFGLTVVTLILLVVVGLVVATALGLHNPSMGPMQHMPQP